MTLTLKQVADHFHKKPRWLQEWLRAHPGDKDGLFYTPVGRDKIFHPNDVARIECAFRESKQCRSSSDRRARVKRRTMK